MAAFLGRKRRPACIAQPGNSAGNAKREIESIVPAPARPGIGRKSLAGGVRLTADQEQTGSRENPTAAQGSPLATARQPGQQTLQRLLTRRIGIASHGDEHAPEGLDGDIRRGADERIEGKHDKARRMDPSIGQQIRDRLLPPPAFLPDLRRGGGNRRRQGRRDALAPADSLVSLVPVGRILDPGLARRKKCGLETMRRHGEEGPDEPDAIARRYRRHSGEAVQAAASEPHDDRLRLVAGVVGEREMQDGMTSAPVEEQPVARLPGLGLEGRAGASGGPTPDQAPAGNTALGEPAGDLERFARGGSPQAVIHGERDDFAAPRARPTVCEKHQRQAVGPARYGDGQAGTLLEGPKGRHKSGEFRLSDGQFLVTAVGAGNRLPDGRSLSRT